MARRYEHSQEEIKAMVMQAANQIIVEQGGAALNVRKIAMTIGYTVGSIYMVFENMADLVLHVNAETLDEIASALNKVETGSASRDLEEIAKAYLKFASLNFNRWSMLFGNRFVDSGHFPDWYRAKMNRLEEIITTQIARLHPENNPQQNQRIGNALWGGIHGVCLLSINGRPDKESLQEAEETLRALVRAFVGEAR
ncbi:TetR/AcrR family transcriptional regulator [Methylotuvimicrobium sp. KM1]|uniref:TetR/AcrR family transcriptional regulator n=1 Tax=Methylotuvimicrobium sp. KM1 TaxID=3377707 RepID=UPI0038505E6A